MQIARSTWQICHSLKSNGQLQQCGTILKRTISTTRMICSTPVLKNADITAAWNCIYLFLMCRYACHFLGVFYWQLFLSALLSDALNISMFSGSPSSYLARLCNANASPHLRTQNMLSIPCTNSLLDVMQDMIVDAPARCSSKCAT